MLCRTSKRMQQTGFKKLVAFGLLMASAWGAAWAQSTPANPAWSAIEQGAKQFVIDNYKVDAPLVNILPFGMCRSIANPVVASATAAAFGVLVPMPCVPVTPAPWISSSRVLIGGAPVITKSSKCMCIWGGQISPLATPAVTIKAG